MPVPNASLGPRKDLPPPYMPWATTPCDAEKFGVPQPSLFGATSGLDIPSNSKKPAVDKVQVTIVARGEVCQETTYTLSLPVFCTVKSVKEEVFGATHGLLKPSMQSLRRGEEDKWGMEVSDAQGRGR